MSKKEYLARLEKLLEGISPEERQAAMEYYMDYLEDAGPEGEQAAMEHLGTPERVAAAIRQGLAGDSSGGEWTEQGYKEAPSWREVPERRAQVSRRENWRKERGRRNILGILILLILMVSCGIPVFTAVASAGLAVVAALGVVCFGGLALVLALTVGGVVLLIMGLVRISLVPGAGAMLTGFGFLCLAGAFFLLPLCPWIFRTVIPGILNGISWLFHRIFGRGGRKA